MKTSGHTEMLSALHNQASLPPEIHSGGKPLYVISDLHLASGINASFNYEGTENFFADASFVRFLQHLEKKDPGQPSILVINGDFIDFLRICDYPTTHNDFTEWESILQTVGIHKTASELRNSIIAKEKTFGLRTNDYKSLWKLHVCIKGHLALFRQLALWIYNGNQLLIVKGNHDLEWYWKPVQQYLQYYFAKLLAQELHQPLVALLPDVVNRTGFYDHYVVIDNKIYIEHGHCYETTTVVEGDILAANQEELNLPFGSFFNRYLINQVELVYPFVDNVRPRQNILLILLRERFPLALKMIFHYLPFAVRLIPKKMWREVFQYVFIFLLIIVIPLAVTGYAIYKSLPPVTFPQNPSWLLQQILSSSKNLVFLLLSYLLGRLLVLLKLNAPHSFSSFAATIFEKHKNLEVVTFGHTHNPEQVNMNGKWYLNTGSWMPVFEASSADIRMDKTYTFLHIHHNTEGKLIIHPLQRWNDDALRIDYLPLIDKK